MTAVITKKNAKVFNQLIAGGGGGGGSGGEFDTIHVKGLATFDDNLVFTKYNTTLEAGLNNISDHESRISLLENGGASDNFNVYAGIDEYIIKGSDLESNNGELLIKNTTALPFAYTGNIFKFSLSSIFSPSIVYCTYRQGKYTNPKFDSATTLTTYESNYPGIAFDPALNINPLIMYTEGNMLIQWTPEQTRLETKNKVKCTTIEADNTFKIYKSVLPDFYEAKSIGAIDEDYFTMTYGYAVGSNEFNALITGQTFTFNDNTFGTSFMLTKQVDGWYGNNLCFTSPKAIYDKADTADDYCMLFIEINDQNKSFLLSGYNWKSTDPPQNLVNELVNNKRYDCASILNTERKHEIKEVGFLKWPAKDWWLLKFRVPDASTAEILYFKFDVETMPEQPMDLPTFARYGTNKYQSANNKTLIKQFHCHIPSKYGKEPFQDLTIYMLSKGNIPMKESDYQQGQNTFSFLSSTADYSVSPKPESCTTLLTNFNIQTTGIVIGENIESHVFAINSIGNTVDLLQNLITIINNQIYQIQSEIAEIKRTQSWWNLVNTIVGIGADIFMTWAGGGFKIGAGIIQGLKKFTLPVDREIDAGEIALEEIRSLIHLSGNPITTTKTLDCEYINTETTEIYNSDFTVTTKYVAHYYVPYLPDKAKILVNGEEVSDVIYDMPNLTINDLNGETSTVTITYETTVTNNAYDPLTETYTDYELFTGAFTRHLIETMMNKNNETIESTYAKKTDVPNGGFTPTSPDGINTMTMTNNGLEIRDITYPTQQMFVRIKGATFEGYSFDPRDGENPTPVHFNGINTNEIHSSSLRIQALDDIFLSGSTLIQGLDIKLNGWGETIVKGRTIDLESQISVAITSPLVKVDNLKNSSEVPYALITDIPNTTLVRQFTDFINTRPVTDTITSTTNELSIVSVKALRSVLKKVNTTITHLCPIEGEDVIHIGHPVFMSGKVYKSVETGFTWLHSTESDYTDCICSVRSKGTWKEYVGICCGIEESHTIKFASHGDFLFKVDDSAIYAIGDTVLFDGRILDEEYALTLRIKRSIVGVVSGKINKTTLAIFRD